MLSRVADSCYWLSRYIERAETNSRLLHVNMNLMLDLEDADHDSVREHWQPVLASLEDQELFNTLYDHIDGESVMEFVTFEKKNPHSIGLWEKQSGRINYLAVALDRFCIKVAWEAACAARSS